MIILRGNETRIQVIRHPLALLARAQRMMIFDFRNHLDFSRSLAPPCLLSSPGVLRDPLFISVFLECPVFLTVSLSIIRVPGDVERRSFASWLLFCGL